MPLLCQKIRSCLQCSEVTTELKCCALGLSRCFELRFFLCFIPQIEISDGEVWWLAVTSCNEIAAVAIILQLVFLMVDENLELPVSGAHHGCFG